MTSEARNGDSIHCLVGWQPITTAPRDGAPILLHMRGEVTCGAYREGEPYPWLVLDFGTDDGTNGWEDTERYGPTDWMPLPEWPLVPKPPNDKDHKRNEVEPS